MRLVAAIAVACCLAASAHAQESVDPFALGEREIGRFVDDPIGLLLSDPIELVLRSSGEATPRPARGRRAESAYNVAALDSDLVAVNTGLPVQPPQRLLRRVGLTPAELAERAYDGAYAKGWPAATAPPPSGGEPKTEVRLDGQIRLRIDGLGPSQSFAIN